MKLLILIQSFLVLLFFSPLSAQAQNYRFSHILTEHILDKADIQSLHQDQYGFVWVGSFDGLIQYDGVKSKAFKRRFSDSNSLNHNIIYGITETPDAIWAVAWGGDGTIINRLDKQTNHVRRIPLGQRNSAFDNVISLKNGNFAIGGSNAITFFNPKTYESKEYESPRSLSTIELPNEIVVSGIADNKLMIYHPKQGLNYTLETLNTGYQTSALCIDTLGAVWLGTHRGLKRYYFDENNHKEQVIERLPDALKTVAITALCISFDGALWIGTATQGLYRWHQKDNTLLHFEANDKLGMLTSNTINVLMEDNNHLLWIGTPQGLNVTDLTPSVFQHIYLPRKNALDHNSSFSVNEDKNRISA